MNRMAVVAGVFCFVCMAVTARGEDAPLPLPVPPLPSIDNLTDSPFAPSTDTTMTVPVDPGSFAPVPPIGGVQSTPLPASGVTGVVNVPRLHVRSGPNPDRYEIIAIALRDAPVTIYSENNGWYSIAYPPNEVCYIRSGAVGAVVPDVIPDGGVTVLSGPDTTDIRVRPWSQSTAIGTLQPGMNITIVGRKGRGSDEYYAIVPPADARAWVKASYITRSDTAALPVADVPAPGNLGAAAAETKKPEKKEEPAQPDRNVVAEAMLKVQADMARRRQEEEAQRKAFLAGIDEQLAAIEQETELRKQSVIAGRSTSVEMVERQPITGWVEFTGRGLRRPAAYRLVKGGMPLFLLRSSAVDLDRFVNKLVAVDGTVEIAPGWEANILDVTRITLLADGPIADGARSSSTATGDDLGTLEFLPARGRDQEPSAADAGASHTLEFSDAPVSVGTDDGGELLPMESVPDSTAPMDDGVVGEAGETLEFLPVRTDE